MTIEFIEHPEIYGEAHGVSVSCQGDIAVLPFFASKDTDGIAWLLLQEREKGEVGRDVLDLDPIDLSKTDGVLIGFKDPVSVGVFIDALIGLKNSLERSQVEKTEGDSEVEGDVGGDGGGEGEEMVRLPWGKVTQ